jgi:FtsP/CotA-like multicopper oxidase with cupredoxin domain
MSRTQRLAALGAAVLIAVLAVVIIGPGSEHQSSRQSGSQSPPPGEERPGDAGSAKSRPTARPKKPEVTRIRVEDLEPVGGVKEVAVESGDTVRLAVTSNRPEEVHVHGFDRSAAVGPGRTARLSFPADLEGVFEVELEGSDTQIAELTVEP